MCQIRVTSGYTGGQKENLTHEEVSTGKTGHYEAVEVMALQSSPMESSLTFFGGR